MRIWRNRPSLSRRRNIKRLSSDEPSILASVSAISEVVADVNHLLP